VPRSTESRDEWSIVPPHPELPLRDDMRLTVAEAAAYFRVEPRKVERWVRDGRLDAIPLPSNRGQLIRGSDIREWLRIPAPATKRR
jgi:excisionase family DNA binding protein